MQLPDKLADGSIEHHFEYAGIQYTVISETEKTCRTREDSANSKVSGSVVLPSVVRDGDAEYTLIEIGDKSFLDNKSIKTVVLPKTIKVIGNSAFCESSIESINLPPSLERIGEYAFYVARNLQEITFPASLKEIGKRCFDGIRVTNIDLSETSLTQISSGTFFNAPNLCSVKLPTTIEKIEASAFGAHKYECPTTATLEIELPQTITEIGEFAFRDRSINTLIIPDKVEVLYQGTCGETVDLTIGSGMKLISGHALPGTGTSYSSSDNSEKTLRILRFKCQTPPEVAGDLNYSTADIAQITMIVPDGTADSYRDHPWWGKFNIREESCDYGVGFTYDGINYNVIDANEGICSISKNPDASGDVIIPQTVPYKNGELKVIGVESEAFANCASLISITLPESVTNIGAYAFWECTGLTSADIRGKVLTIPEYAFARCTNMTSIKLPDTVLSIGEGAFWVCKSLSSIKLPESLSLIDDAAFSNCHSLASIDLPNDLMLIQRYAFCWCKSLNSVKLPYGLTSLAEGTFKGCNSLTSVTIPETISNVGESVFEECNVTELCYISKAPHFQRSQISAIPNSAILYVPKGSKATYESTAGWNEFEKIVEIEISAGEIKFSESDIAISLNQEYQLVADVYPLCASNKTITWASSNPAIVNVSDFGFIKGISSGVATITASCGEVSASCEVEVAEILLNAELIKLCKDEDFQLDFSVDPETTAERPLIWTSSNEQVATVSDAGLISAHGIGSAVISAQYRNITASCVVAVLPTQITLDEKYASIEIGASRRLTATIYPQSAADKAIEWRSSNPEVAEVSKNGEVTALSSGMAAIFASSEDDTAFCVLTVPDDLDNSLPILSINLTVGETLNLSTIIDPPTDDDVIWSSSNNQVAEVTDSGVVTAKKQGTAIITAACGKKTLMFILDIQ